MVEVLSVGAEAVIIRDDGKVIKRRVKKGYRIKEIDEELRRSRTKFESRIMEKARRIGVRVPKVLEVREFEIVMEYIDGKRISEILEEEDYRKIGREVGRMLGTLHKNGIVHGDPTTSNFIKRGEEIYLIDFGLADYSERIEDFAVDLLLLKRALLSKHPRIFEEFWEEFCKGYSEVFGKAGDVFKRIGEIERRGRYVKRNVK